MALRVFISYSHDSQEHMDRVWDLSERLLGDGVDCCIDQHEEAPAEGWPRWCKHQIRDANFVFVVCTATYLRRYEGDEEEGKGLGGQWEGYVITQKLYQVQGKNNKFIPVVFFSADSEYVPDELGGATRYNLSETEDYEKLFRRITAQPRRKRSPIASQVRRMPLLQKNEVGEEEGDLLREELSRIQTLRRDKLIDDVVAIEAQRKKLGLIP